MRIKTLRASGLRIQADVVIGTADNGSLVTTHVVIDRAKNDELEGALLPLENLLLRTAEERTGQAKTNAIIDARVNERLTKVMEPERERLRAHYDAEVANATRAAQHQRDEADRKLAAANRELTDQAERLASLRDRNAQLQEELRTAQQQREAATS